MEYQLEAAFCINEQKVKTLIVKLITMSPILRSNINFLFFELDCFVIHLGFGKEPSLPPPLNPLKVPIKKKP